MDETTCMVDMARFFLDFTKKESCGKCTFCRVGTQRMLEILTRITKGEGKAGDIETLIELSNQIKDSSLCGLGQTAPNPVLTTIKYFRDEYEAELDDFVLAKVESGRYENASEVVRAALRTLEREEKQYEAKLAALRRAIDEGDASGVAGGNSFERVRGTLKLPRKKR